jgi:branched-chain amino acid transport system substrate-binding protein
MIGRQGIAAASFACLACVSVSAAAENAPGITATEIKIGQTVAYSGPAAVYGTAGKAAAAYFAMINEHGGINRRKITLISVDDAYNPAKTVEQTRKLVEELGVALIFAPIGTAPVLATRQYLNDHKIPQLFAVSGASVIFDPVHHPWTMGGIASYALDGRMVAAYVLKHKPNAKIAVLYQNDDFGKDSLGGLKTGLGDKAESMIVKEASYELSDPTVDSQIIALQESGADVFYNVTTPKTAAQAIRKGSDLNWKPLQFVTPASASIAATFVPAGLDKSVGIMSHIVIEDPQDPRWKDDPAIKNYVAWMERYYPKPDIKNGLISLGYFYAMFLTIILTQCGDDLSREHIMQVMTHLHALNVPMLMPGITVSTSPADYQMFKSMRNIRFDGKRWVLLDLD